MTEMEFRIKKSRFSITSRFNESKCVDGNHSLNRDFTVFVIVCNNILNGNSMLFLLYNESALSRTR